MTTLDLNLQGDVIVADLVFDGLESSIIVEIVDNDLHIDMPDLPIGIHGKSAYELAVLNGYTGTEQDWLASLAIETVDPITMTTDPLAYYILARS